ncbi:hypothetical protein [Methanobacterium alcaliphilum]|uniref:hypothetical protein n=1 Tax=Methanobacterium alcaliphilum TaxID=392018 RepID=UPI00200A7464|nr:hypothetical protein [Methanobacterium alcaliphilum]MCK9150978.1 hypothetical protein [Methanobacterium alcaliphilum]
MDIDDYEKLIISTVDIEIETSSISESRKTLLTLHERREILKDIQSRLERDIRSVEVDYLNKRTFIREEFSSTNFEKSSKMKKMLKGGTSSPARRRAKAMKNLEKERNSKIEGYRDMKVNVDDLIEQIEEIMVDVYSSIKSLLGNNY